MPRHIAILFVLLSLPIFAAESDASIRQKLETPITFRIKDIPLSRAVELLAKRCGVELDFKSDPSRPEEPKVELDLKNVRGIDVLEIWRLTENLICRISEGKLRVGVSKPVAEIYDVDDLTRSPPMMICGTGMPAPEPGVAHKEPQQMNPTLTNIADMIRNRVYPDLWDAALGTMICERGGKLIIAQYPEVHAEIKSLLAELRSSILRQIAIEAKVLAVRTTELDSILDAAQKRKSAWPYLDDAAMTALEQAVESGRARQVFSGTATCLNMQKTFLSDLTEQKYVAEIDVSGESYMPLVRNLMCGTLIDLVPILSFDDEFVRVTLRATHTQLREMKSLVVQRGGSHIVIPYEPEVKAEEAAEKPKKEEKVKEKEEVKKVTIDQISVQLPTTTMARVRNEMYVKTGRWVGATTPLSNREGLVAGEEMLVLLKLTPVLDKNAVPKSSQPQPTLSADLADAMNKPVGPFVEEPQFYKVIQRLSEQTGVPIALSRQVDDARMNTEIRFDAKVLTFKSALAQIAKNAEVDLVELNSLLLVTLRNAATRVSFEVYPLQDLTDTCTDFPGPMEPNENPLSGEAKSFPRTADIASMIKENWLPQEFIIPVASIEEQHEKLFVVNTPEAQLQVKQKLREYRKTIMRPVQLTGRWAIVDAQSLKATFAGKIPSVLTPAEVEQAAKLFSLSTSKLIATARYSLLNGQAHTFSGATHAQVAEYDIVGDLPDPAVRTAVEGAKLEARISGTNDHLIDLTARLHKILESSNFEMTKKPAAGGEPSARTGMGVVQSNKIKKNDVCTSVTVPDGGGALYQMPVPEWVSGESPDAIAKNQRVLILVVSARRQQD